MTNRQRRIILGVLLIIAVAITLIMTSATMPEQTSPKAKITFYPCNGAMASSYVAYSTPLISDGFIKFKNKEGNDIYISGSYSLIIF